MGLRLPGQPTADGYLGGERANYPFNDFARRVNRWTKK